MSRTEMSCGTKQKESNNNTITIKKEKTHFDPNTGKKIVKETECITRANVVETQTEQWLKIKEERIQKLEQFKRIPIETAKNKSKVFAIYKEEFYKALVALETLRNKLKLSYTSTDPCKSIWFNLDVVQLFVFGVTNDLYEGEEVPDHFQYLICCWSWQELVDWSNQPEMRALSGEPSFIIRSEMIAKHTLGCMVCHHLPKLHSIMRKQNIDFIKSDNFPSLMELRNDDVGYETLVFSYSFTLSRILNLPSQNARFAIRDGLCCISIDGMMSKLLINGISNRVCDLFEQQALNGPKR